MTRNSYTMNDRIIAFALYKQGSIDSIGLFDIKKIVELTGHSKASFQMKVDQFKGVAGCRKKAYIPDAEGPGLSEWAEADEAVWNLYQDTDPAAMTKIAKEILCQIFSNRV